MTIFYATILTHVKIQFERDISLLLEGCNEYVVRIIAEMAEALKASPRRENALYQQKD